MFTLPTPYDANLIQLAHYQNFPQILPFIGVHYTNTHLLLVGESHYLPTGSTIQQDAAVWYASNVQFLTTDETIWTNTREVTTEYPTSGRIDKAYTIWSNLENAIQKHATKNAFNLQGKKGIEHLAFYNFFQRPAQTQGGSISPTELDNQKAEETLAHIIKVIKPKFIMFTSSKAWENISEDFVNTYSSIKFGFSPYPGCKWWNKQSGKYGGLTGKQKFIKFLQDNNIF